MPLVRIDLVGGRTPEQVREIADTVQDVMLDVFAAPPRDRYPDLAVNIEHEDATFGQVQGLEYAARNLIATGEQAGVLD